MRTHHCNQLRAADIGRSVTLVGWVNATRDLGGMIFIDLRDREGLTQVVFRPEEDAAIAEASRALHGEDVIRVTGVVGPRPDVGGRPTVNPDLPTGEIEVTARSLEVLNKAAVLPFQLEPESTGEDLRMKYRYLDLRRPRLAANLRTRHRVTMAARAFLDEQGFLEIETPILSKSTPEGARDFLVPSRIQPGNFYALPQAPQQYKQLLMVAGAEKYFQIARCFRDEDLRADRQPEFTQIDIEASFVRQDDIIRLVEGMLARIFLDTRGVTIPAAFDRLTWREALNRYGSDKPDRRFGLELTDLSDLFATSGFKVFAGAVERGGVVKAINAKGLATITSGQVDALTQLALHHGAKGLAYIQARGEDPASWRSPIGKFLSPAEIEGLRQRLNVEPGDLVLFGAGQWLQVCEVLGRLRLACADHLKLLEGDDRLDFLWVTEFPLLAFDAEEQRWMAVHHPFTRPHPDDEAALRAGDFGDGLRACAYDVVLNGNELGGGSIRIHEGDLQAAMFRALGLGEDEVALQFGHLLEAFSFGAPPHGGIALGLDRLTMLICGEQSIRDVIAFPKNNKGFDIMTQSPSPVDPRQLRDLRLELRAKQP